MITVVCLSPSIDETILLPSLALGATNRAQEKRTAAGGKGVNVAMTLAAMGESVQLVLPRHQAGAQPLFDELERAPVRCISVDVPGALRVNLKLLDTSCDMVTEVNASAEPIPEDALSQLEEAIAAAAQQSGWLVLTGSLPKGCAADVYARIICRVRRGAPDCRIALDAEGEPLRLGVNKSPDFIKPNRHELELLMGRHLDTEEDILAAAEQVAAGVNSVLVSLGEAGAMLLCGGAVYRAKAIPVPVATTVGAGDALLSGYLHAHAKGAREAFAYAAAAAAARVAGRDGEAEAFLPQAEIWLKD